MIDISPDARIKATIKPGSVYYFTEDSFGKTSPHFFIVINNDPLNDEALFLVCATSQIEKCKKRRKNKQETLVEIKCSEYQDFTCDTIVDCNNIFIKSIDVIIEKMKNGNLKQKKHIDFSHPCLLNIAKYQQKRF